MSSDRTQNLIEAHFNTVRKMADAKFARARTWEKMITTHRKWMQDFNSQRHWAHEKREDGLHSPAAVLGDQKGRVYPESVLSHILFATRYVRHLDKNGYLRYQNWRFYGERGLAKAKVTVWIYEGSLKVEHQAVTLSEYEVKLQEDRKHLQTVNNARQHATPFRSPQLTLFDLGSDGWVLYWKTPDHAPARRKQQVEGILQLSLFELEPMAQAVGADERAGQTPMRSHLQLISEQESGPSL